MAAKSSDSRFSQPSLIPEETRSAGLSPGGDELREAIQASLLEQGFTMAEGLIVTPELDDKSALRRLHARAVEHRIEAAQRGLRRHEPMLLERFARGSAMRPEEIRPRLVEVRARTEDELLFRYARLHWSIPISAGYGRRLRFLVVDEAHNDALIGIIGLGDPVFALRPRDAWVGWDRDMRRSSLAHVMDAFVLGAVPPYSFLLGGKLVAMLAAADEVRTAFARKYGGGRGVISGEVFGGELAMVTTTSALGRSSIYNRLAYQPEPHDPASRRLLYRSVGFTLGSGEFHFSNGLYKAMTDYALANCQPTAKAAKWGTGFRSRREVVRKTLRHLGLPDRLIYHGVQREVFVVPLARNTASFLRGEEDRLVTYGQSAEALGAYFKERWLSKRLKIEQRHLSWEPNAWRLWTDQRIPERLVGGSR
jgi:hypothetical protein